MSSSYSTQYYSATGALPIPSAGGKDHYGQYPSYYNSGDSNYSVSPPEDLDVSVSSGTAGGMTSHGGYSTYSVPASSYAGSINQGEYDSTVGSARDIDLNDYMQDRFADSFDPLPLDKVTAKQAQASGLLNAKHRALLEMQAKTQARIAKTRARFAEGLEDARAVRNDLEYTQRKMEGLKTKASKKHSKEYSKARARHPSPDAY